MPRIFVNFPKWGDEVASSVVEIFKGKTIAYPNEAINQTNGADDRLFVSVQSVVVDPLDRLWILDTGSPLFKQTEYGGPKLMCKYHILHSRLDYRNGLGTIA